MAASRGSFPRRLAVLLAFSAGLAAYKAEASTNTASARVLFAGAITTNELGHLLVPVSLVAQGDEAAITFTLRYSTGALAYASYTVPDYDTNALVVPLGTSRTTNAPLSANYVTNQVGTGAVGFTLTLPSGSHLRAGSRSLVSAEFTPATNAAAAIIAAGLALESLGLTDTGGTNAPVVAAVTPQYMGSVAVTNLAEQNGLFVSRLTFANPGSAAIAGAWVLVQNLTKDTNGYLIVLYNATGTTNSVPYLQLGPLAAGATAELTAEFYVSDRQTVPTPSYQMVVMPFEAPAISTNAPVRLDRQLFTNGVFYVEFVSVTNGLYYVQYADDLNSTNWSTSQPLIIGNGARVQWIDNGPPRTTTPPASQTNRFYRVFQQ